MRYATNIENEGDCPDCNAYEAKIDRLNAKIDSLEKQAQEADREGYNRALDDVQRLALQIYENRPRKWLIEELKKLRK